MKRIFQLFCLVLISQFAEAQSYARFSPPVKVDGRELKFPWAGGLNAPQFSEADFNNDGINDLFVFDRVGDVPMVFLNGGTPNQIDYSLAPEYLEGLPKLNSWVLLRDFNADGIADIFCFPNFSSASGIEVYRGYYDDNRLQFELFRFPGFSHDIIPFRTRSGSLLNLAVTTIDIPAIDDIDNDGDLDVVTFNLNGGQLELYENQSVEQGFGADSLIFILEDLCWGGVYESGNTPELDLADMMCECAKKVQIVDDRHVGSTILTLDMDNDCDKEVLLGDVSFDHMVMAFNGGDCSKAWMTSQDTFFPSADVSINIPSFPAAFYLDVDNDSKKDLIIARNVKLGGEDDEPAWFYKNVGSSEFPQFELRQKDFLSNEMLDFGTGAFPVFVDYNKDGLLDILAGNEGIYDRFGGPSFESKLFLFRNTGSPEDPSYELETDNWLDFRRFSKVGGGDDWAFNPSFGDLDSDGDEDLLIGSLGGGFYYLENTAGAGNPLDFAFPIAKFADIDVSQLSAPLVGDFNDDGLNDVLLTEFNANINFFENIGSVGMPDFDKDVNNGSNALFFGGIDLRENGFDIGYGTPSIIEANAGVQLVTGNYYGSIRMYELGMNPSDTFELLGANIGNTYNGWRTDPALANIDDDDFYEMVVGNERGGLTFYKTDLVHVTVSTSNPVSNLNFEAYPNPASEQMTISVSENGKIRFTDSLGRLVLSQKVSIGKNIINLDEHLSGIFIISFENRKGERAMKKIILN